ncbi:MAG: hypothetical protein RIS94_3296 [Pseudomonadota bacterium]|jgi:hypothetical protein
MGKATARRIDPMIAQADIPAAQMARGEYDIAAVPNPHGEVYVNGALKQHRAVRKVPHYQTLYRAGTIDRQTYNVLDWYAARLSLAESGMFGCALSGEVGNRRAAGSVSIDHAAMQARFDVKWAAGEIGQGLFEVFDAVMRDELTFVEIARRACAHRHVRASVRTERRNQQRAFLKASKRLVDAVAGRFGIRGLRVAEG